jgi:hypothetical protein
VAPPQTGTFVGETNGFGVQGPSIQFPAWNLPLPTIQLPSLFQTHTNPFLKMDSATAPFMPGQPALYAPVAPGGALVPAAPVAPAAPSQPPAAPSAQPPQKPTPPSPPPRCPNGRCTPDRCTDNDWQQRLYDNQRATAELNQRMDRIERCLERIVIAQSQIAQSQIAQSQIAQSQMANSAPAATTPTRRGVPQHDAAPTANEPRAAGESAAPPAPPTRRWPLNVRPVGAAQGNLRIVQPTAYGEPIYHPAPAPPAAPQRLPTPQDGEVQPIPGPGRVHPASGPSPLPSATGYDRNPEHERVLIRWARERFGDGTAKVGQ